MTRARTFSRMWLVITLPALAGATAVVLAQAPAADHHREVAEPSAAQATAPGAAEREQMMKSMAASDQKLSDLVATMKAATGDRKVAAIAEIVTELVAQRRQMQEQMRMQGAMMEEMMSHLSSMHGSGGGMMKKTPESAPGTAGQDHAEHHPQK